MSLRHVPRPSERERTHDAPSVPPHPHSIISHPPHSAHPSHPPPPPPHLNGGTTTPAGIPNGSSPAAAATAIPNGVAPTSSAIHKLNLANEQTWLLIGRVAEQMGDLEHALTAYENALRHNPMSLSGLTQVAGIFRIKENYPRAVEYFQRVLTLQEDNGEVWSALGHCYLMQDDLQKAYSAYQQALYLLPNPKEDPKLWYGIGILYDRYGSLDHAEEAFSSVLRMDSELDFDKSNEILFRLGIIYKQQCKYDESLACFDRILRSPPSPLAHADIWFQIGHVYEQQKDHARAKDAYERVVADNPGHAKVLQQLGWLYHQDGTTFQNQDLAIQYLTKSLEADPSDAQSWYLLGRAYMAGQKYNKAYEAYQQAVYRDGRNPTFWCSIGVLYFQINQFRDALDAYSRAIRINPYISEVWFDLGSLYESCNNQISDAIDAYARAAELDPNNPAITQRLQLLKTAQATGGQLPAAPGPQDVHPTAYASAVVPPHGLTGPPLLLQSSTHRPPFRADSRGPPNEISLPPPSQVGTSHTSPGPFRGGPPPPVVLDEARHPQSHTPLAPMEVDRPHARDARDGRDYPGPPTREGPGRGPVGHQSLLLQHPVPQQQARVEELRSDPHGHHHQESFFTRGRPASRSPSPRPHVTSRARSPPPPPPPFQGYPPSRQPVGPAQPSAVPSHRSPRMYARHEPSRAVEPEVGWDRRPIPSDHREWEKEREPRSRHGPEYPPPPPPSSFYPTRSPSSSNLRAHSPPQPSPRSHPIRYWDSKPPNGPASVHPSHGRPSPPPPENVSRRYDPRHDAPREQREYEDRAYAGSPEGSRNAPRNPQPHIVVGSNTRRSESPRLPEQKDRRRRVARDREPEPPVLVPAPQPEQPQKQRKKRGSKRKDDRTGSETPKPFGAGERTGPPGSSSVGAYKLPGPYLKGPGSPEVSSNGSGSSRSVQPSPTNAAARPPSRVVDEDYDEGVADALMGLASYRAPGAQAPAEPSHSPTVSSGSRHSHASPRPAPSHRNSVSSTRSHVSPPMQSATLKRPLSPGSDESDNKRSRVDNSKRRASSPTGGRGTPLPSTRPSPIPFRTQPVPASHSPEARQPHDPYPPSPPLPAVLPPHPRPVGAGLSSSTSHGGSSSAPIALPPIATLSPPSTVPSPGERDQREREDRMQVDAKRSISPPSRPKEGGAPVTSSRSPPAKNTPSPSSEKNSTSS
ncbi:putative tetratricopeptide repeat [Lyophyllum shimeji]|uniref:Tetratricopeptide repeat n=1 Tax=Lyophyllum shimeji TaxID=47721 RepID=A0A9P3UMC4_LYOSH|nr:putative tetratricopeptide repeat [Lyophyllum shimeji]